MSEGLTIINQEVIKCILTNKKVDISLINNEIESFSKSLKLEKNNITEVGEGNLVSGIETGFNEYRNSVEKFVKSPKSFDEVISLQKEYDSVYQST